VPLLRSVAIALRSTEELALPTAVTPPPPALVDVVEQTIAPSAAEVDRTGAFPRADIDALAGAGVLGLLSAAEVGAPVARSPMPP
jgi:hypothetical protein